MFLNSLRPFLSLEDSSSRCLQGKQLTNLFFLLTQAKFRFLRASEATSDVSKKTGLFTFAVKRDITLRGVVIVADKDQESYQVSLSITQRGKKNKTNQK